MNKRPRVTLTAQMQAYIRGMKQAARSTRPAEDETDDGRD